MVEAAKAYGAKFVLVGALTLFGGKQTDCKTLYYNFLEKYYPELIPKYKSLYGNSFQPSKEYQRRLEEKTVKICGRYGVNHKILA